jgi:hypothetical protein
MPIMDRRGLGELGDRLAGLLYSIESNRIESNRIESNRIESNRIEYEYRDAEYEYGKKQEQSIGPKYSIERF